MFLNDLLHRREAESRSCPLRREERLEYLIDDFRGNRSAIVLDENLIFESAAGPMLRRVNRELSTGSHRFTGILENAEEDLLQFRLVSSHRRQDGRILFGHLNSGNLEISGHDGQRAFDNFRNADQASIQLKRFGEIQNLIENRFDPDQIAHGIFHARLRIEIEDAFSRDFFQLGAYGSQRLTDFGGEKCAEFADRGLPLLLADYGFQWDRSLLDWSGSGLTGVCRGCGSGRCRRRCLKKIGKLQNRRFQRPRIRRLIAVRFA